MCILHKIHVDTHFLSIKSNYLPLETDFMIPLSLLEPITYTQVCTFNNETFDAKHITRTMKWISHSLQCDSGEENKKIACDNGIKCHHCCWHKKTIKCHLQLLIVVTQHATTTCLSYWIEMKRNMSVVCVCVLRVETPNNK